MYRPQTKPEWRESAHLQGAQKDRTACRFDLQRSTPGHWQSLLSPRAPDPETQLVGLSEIRLRNGDAERVSDKTPGVLPVNAQLVVALHADRATLIQKMNERGPIGIHVRGVPLEVENHMPAAVGTTVARCV